MNNSSENNIKNRVDQNFLSAVATVRETNKHFRCKPYSNRGISEVLGGENIITKIKNDGRSVTIEQLSLFCQTFFLPVDWMFTNEDPDEEIEYDYNRYAESVNREPSKYETRIKNWTGVNGDNQGVVNQVAEFNGSINQTFNSDKEIESLREQLRVSESEKQTMEEVINSQNRQIDILETRLEKMTKLKNSLSKELDMLTNTD